MTDSQSRIHQKQILSILCRLMLQSTRIQQMVIWRYLYH